MPFQCFHLNCSCNIFAQKGLRKTTLVEEKKCNLVLMTPVETLGMNFVGIVINSGYLNSIEQLTRN